MQWHVWAPRYGHLPYLTCLNPTRHFVQVVKQWKGRRIRQSSKAQYAHWQCIELTRSYNMRDEKAQSDKAHYAMAMTAIYVCVVYMSCICRVCVVCVSWWGGMSGGDGGVSEHYAPQIGTRGRKHNNNRPPNNRIDTRGG